MPIELSMPADDRQALTALAAALPPFKEVNKIGSMPLSIVEKFILVALWPGKRLGNTRSWLIAT
jgi:hypothetical protein